MSADAPLVPLSEAQRLQLLVERIVDYAIYMLDPNGIVSSWNTGAQRMKGYLADEIIGQHFSRFYTEQERQAGVPDRALRTAREEGRYEAEGWRVRKDGSLFWASVVVDAIRDDGGTLVGFAKITRDITERREAQIALKKAEAQSAHIQKMEALGQLTGGVAHDFNNLLMVVSSYIQTLKKLTENDPKGLRAATAIETAAKRGAALTRQLLSFSRRQMLNPAITHIEERVEAVRPMIAGSLGATVVLATRIPSDVWPVRADVSEFDLALINLALNARDAMDGNGVITVSAENVTLGPNDMSENLEGDFVALSISDTGSGIAADILPRVFDPFFTTKPRAKGTGLGLSQVHGFAHQAGGTATIASELGSGTKITLYLPRAQIEEGELDMASTLHESGKLRILLVEDNPDVAEASAALAEQIGHEIHRVADAGSALDAIEGQEFDLVISDIVMAGSMDGLGLARTLRQRRPDLPVLLVTGYSTVLSIAEPEFMVLRKPYSLTDLTRAIATIIAQRKSSDKLVNLSDVQRAQRAKSNLF